MKRMRRMWRSSIVPSCRAVIVAVILGVVVSMTRTTTSLLLLPPVPVYDPRPSHRRYKPMMMVRLPQPPPLSPPLAMRKHTTTTSRSSSSVSSSSRGSTKDWYNSETNDHQEKDPPVFVSGPYRGDSAQPRQPLTPLQRPHNNNNDHLCLLSSTRLYDYDDDNDDIDDENEEANSVMVRFKESSTSFTGSADVIENDYENDYEDEDDNNYHIEEDNDEEEDWDDDDVGGAFPSGNFWYNPKPGLDVPPVPSSFSSSSLSSSSSPSSSSHTRTSHDARTIIRQGRQRKYPSSAVTTTFRSGTPPPPAPVRDLYQRLFWYGFMDADDTDTTTTSSSSSHPTMFGGARTRGKFNGLAYFQPPPPEDEDDGDDDDEADEQDPPLPRTTRGSQQRPQQQQQQRVRIPVTPPFDPPLFMRSPPTPIQMPSPLHHRREPRRRRRRQRRRMDDDTDDDEEDDHYYYAEKYRRHDDDDDNNNDNDDNHNHNDDIDWIAQKVSVWFGPHDVQSQSYDPIRQPQRRRKSRTTTTTRESSSSSSWSVMGMLETFLGLDRIDWDESAAEYDRQMGIQRPFKKEPHSRRQQQPPQPPPQQQHRRKLQRQPPSSSSVRGVIPVATTKNEYSYTLEDDSTLKVDDDDDVDDDDVDADIVDVESSSFFSSPRRRSERSPFPSSSIKEETTSSSSSRAFRRASQGRRSEQLMQAHSTYRYPKKDELHNNIAQGRAEVNVTDSFLSDIYYDKENDVNGDQNDTSKYSHEQNYASATTATATTPLSLQERALAVERVPPAGIAAWGPSGEWGMDARTRAIHDALEDVQSAQQRVDQCQQEVNRAKEWVAIAQVDAELDRKRSQKQSRRNHNNRHPDPNNDDDDYSPVARHSVRRPREWQVQEASRALRYARNRLMQAQEKLEALKERHWAVLSFKKEDDEAVDDAKGEMKDHESGA